MIRIPFAPAPTAIVQQIAVQAPLGAVVILLGRPVRIVRRIACMKGELMIIEETTAVGRALPGQYGLWPAEVVDEAWAMQAARLGSPTL
ncbi:hypothetical protein [Azospirillum brasilense]|uniref:hypothetical protein n=1 Tax=Azospirillum brasilense TaxID=192 RepID=UPI001EDC74FD|nr:hypothetical protein [Azospirillum brasilense]UKJ74543.1 hypothetical protein H1Q64_18465 [Azospirillum brasilense]